MVWTPASFSSRYCCSAGTPTRTASPPGSAPARGAALYGLVLLLPFLTLPFAIGPDAQPPAAGNPDGWLLLVLAKSIGLPFFALAATAPILQRWFADTDHPSANDPYFLVRRQQPGQPARPRDVPAGIIEPMLRLRTQNQLWAIGYGVFVVAACLASPPAGGERHETPRGGAGAGLRPGSGQVARRHGKRTRVTWHMRSAPPKESPRPRPGSAARTWIALAFVPSSLMLAVTTYFSTDIAPVPLFWIAPLALYLLTFVVAFSARSASVRSSCRPRTCRSSRCRSWS